MTIDLRRVLSYYPAAASSRTELLAALKAMYPNEKQETNVLVSIFDSGVLNELRPNSAVDNIRMNQILQRAMRSCVLDKTDVKEGLRVWAAALGVTIYNVNQPASAANTAQPAASAAPAAAAQPTTPVYTAQPQNTAPASKPNTSFLSKCKTFWPVIAAAAAIAIAVGIWAGTRTGTKVTTGSAALPAASFTASSAEKVSTAQPKGSYYPSSTAEVPLRIMNRSEYSLDGILDSNRETYARGTRTTAAEQNMGTGYHVYQEYSGNGEYAIEYIYYNGILAQISGYVLHNSQFSLEMAIIYEAYDNGSTALFPYAVVEYQTDSNGVPIQVNYYSMSAQNEMALERFVICQYNNSQNEIAYSEYDANGQLSNFYVLGTDSGGNVYIYYDYRTDGLFHACEPYNG